MIKDITLGQFFPGNSVIHRLDPRMKLILMIVFVVGTFIAKAALSFALCLIVTVALVLISGVRFSVVIKGLKPIVFVILLTAVFNLFLIKGEGEPLVSLGIIKIYEEGIAYAVMIAVRIVCIIAGTSILLTYTTSPIALTDGLEQLLAPLKKLKIPVHDFSMMMTMALRFIPTLIEETDKIMNAQKARGADFTSGGLIKRAKALIPVMIPLFVSSFHRAEELAVAMECRCYRGDNGRTRMTRLKTSARDWISLVLMLLFCASILLINEFLPILYYFA
ncbi:MAG: energy-coupling factor transporter transmembrane protein EcfT [Clostridia bacterium]|nr:energy-coupling factor transporter transmembrane protein EcfT [Clostridia bacterium]